MGGETAHAVEHRDHHGGTEVAVILYALIVFSFGQDLLGKGLHLVRKGRFPFFLAVKTKAFDSLGPQHRAGPGPAGGSPVVVFHYGEADQIFPGRPDDQSRAPFLRGAHPLFAHAPQDFIFGRVSIHPPEVLGRVKADRLVTDFQEDGFLGGAGNQDGVVPGAADGFGGLAPGIGFSVKTRSAGSW